MGDPLFVLQCIVGFLFIRDRRKRQTPALGYDKKQFLSVLYHNKQFLSVLSFLLNRKLWFYLFFLRIGMISPTPEPLTTFLGHEEEPKVLGHTLEQSREATPPYSNTTIRCACGYCNCVTCPQTQKALNNSYGVYLDPTRMQHPHKIPPGNLCSSAQTRIKA